ISNTSSEGNAGMSSPKSLAADRSYLQSVLERIHEAELRSQRTPGSVTLIAVSKTKTAEAVVQAAKNGAIHFGENYVQEALKKVEEGIPSNTLKWHFIGALQTNKCKQVVGKFQTIQSVDRLDLAKAIHVRAAEAGVIQNILIQVKLGDEPTKGGLSPSEGSS